MTDADTIVRKQIVVDAPIERAFTVFTDRFGDCSASNRHSRVASEPASGNGTAYCWVVSMRRSPIRLWKVTFCSTSLP